MKLSTLVKTFSFKKFTIGLALVSIGLGFMPPALAAGAEVTYSCGLAESTAGILCCDDPDFKEAQERAQAVHGPNFKLDCLAPTTPDKENINYAEDPLACFLQNQGYDLGLICGNAIACPIPGTYTSGSGINGSADTIDGVTMCPLADTSNQCFQGPYGGYSHCSENDLPLDIYPSFGNVSFDVLARRLAEQTNNIALHAQIDTMLSPTTSDDTRKSIRNQISKQYVHELLELNPRNLDVLAPEKGKVVNKYNTDLGGILEILGDSGVLYKLNHLDYKNISVSVDEQVALGQKIAVLDVEVYGYVDIHLHITGWVGQISSGTAIDPYYLFGEQLGCNAIRPPAGAAYQSAQGISAGMCKYAAGGLNDNSCNGSQSKYVPVENSQVSALFAAKYGSNTAVSVPVGSSSSVPTTGVVESSGADSGLTESAVGNCGAGYCALPPKNGVNYPVCPNGSYSLCDNPNQMNVVFGNGQPIDRSLNCEAQANSVGGGFDKQVVSFLGMSFTVNSKIVPVLQKVEAEINAMATSRNGAAYVFPSGPFTFRSSGAFNARPIRGYENTTGAACSISNHSWGTALDINAGTNGLAYFGALCAGTGRVLNFDMPPEVVLAFERNGFRWGGRYTRFDPMHFEYCQATVTNLPNTPTQGGDFQCRIDDEFENRTNPGGDITREDVLSLCSPTTTSYEAVTLDQVYTAFNKVSRLERNAHNDRRINEILGEARAGNVNPAFLFAFWFTEGGYLGDGIAGVGRTSSRVGVGFDFGCGISAACGYAQRLDSNPGQAVIDAGFTSSLQCAAKTSAGCKLACSYSAISSSGPQVIQGYGTQQGGLGGFLECYGPIADSNQHFAKNFTKLYDAIFPPNSSNGRKQAGGCTMLL